MKIFLYLLIMSWSFSIMAESPLLVTGPHSTLEFIKINSGYEMISTKQSNKKHVKKISNDEFVRIRDKFYNLVLENISVLKKEKCQGLLIQVSLRTLKESSSICSTNSNIYHRTKGLMAQVILEPRILK